MFDTVASQVSALSFVDIFNFCVFLTFTICYTYQLFYVLVVLTRRAPKKVARANHRYAVMVAARNEETVIADLIHSIKVQNYPASSSTSSSSPTTALITRPTWPARPAPSCSPAATTSWWGRAMRSITA